MKKIDMHCHTTNRKVSGLLFEHPTLEVISEEMKKYDVEKAVLLATYFPHKGTGISNFRLLNWMNGKSQFEMFGSLDFDTFYLQGMNELEELAQRKLMKGIKVYTCYQHIDLKSERFNALVNLADRFGLPMMFHVGYSYSCMSKCGKVAYTEPVSPKNLEPVAREHGNVNFIFSHMGKPFFDELLEVVNSCDNVYTDNSGLLDFDHNQNELEECVEDLKKFLGVCGPSKLLFGTDFPVQTYKDSVALVEASMKDYSDEDKFRVYYSNAERLLKLK